MKRIAFYRGEVTIYSEEENMHPLLGYLEYNLDTLDRLGTRMDNVHTPKTDAAASEVRRLWLIFEGEGEGEKPNWSETVSTTGWTGEAAQFHAWCYSRGIYLPTVAISDNFVYKDGQPFTHR